MNFDRITLHGIAFEVTHKPASGGDALRCMERARAKQPGLYFSRTYLPARGWLVLVRIDPVTGVPMVRPAVTPYLTPVGKESL